MTGKPRRGGRSGKDGTVKKQEREGGKEDL